MEKIITKQKYSEYIKENNLEEGKDIVHYNITSDSFCYNSDIYDDIQNGYDVICGSSEIQEIIEEKDKTIIYFERVEKENKHPIFGY